MTPISRPICLPECEFSRINQLWAVFGALLVIWAGIYLLQARTEATERVLAAKNAEVASLRIALLDRCPVPLDGQVIGSRRDGRAVCVAVDNLQLPKGVK